MSLGRIPKQLGPNVKVHLIKDGPLGSGGPVGNHKVKPTAYENDPNGVVDSKPNKRHYSVSSLNTVLTKQRSDGTLVDQYGRSIESLRKRYDIKKAPIKESLSFKRWLEENYMIAFKEYLEEQQNAGVISASGVNAQRHAEKYLHPHVKSGKFSHTMAKGHGSIAVGSNVKVHKVETIDGKTNVHVEDEHGNKERVLASKLHKPGVKTENRGHEFENKFIDHLKKHGLMDKDAQGAGSTAGTDFHVINKRKKMKHPGKLLSNNATELNGETKQDSTAAMGQITIKHSKERGWHVPEDARAKRPEYAKHVDEHIIPHMNKHYPNGPSDQRVTASGRAASDRIKHPDMKPAEGYLKDHHVDLLHVGGGKGTYSVGKDKTGHGLPNIKGKGLWTVRDKAKTPNARTVMFQPDGRHGLEPSHVNLENEDHIKEFKKTLGH